MGVELTTAFAWRVIDEYIEERY
ncbi:hypothetical protein CCACVL1_11689 [Corchorus capsularis]|uniref:Uncharacterized protein n=1 Tax=Corchorus capsularis TaxID=210143 RepID=A0A1R3IK66_COCAP|nr:hypothetical protein CCACVL1_11689 [Corchorus capsularis]